MKHLMNAYVKKDNLTFCYGLQKKDREKPSMTYKKMPKWMQKAVDAGFVQDDRNGRWFCYGNEITDDKLVVLTPDQRLHFMSKDEFQKNYIKVDLVEIE